MKCKFCQGYPHPYIFFGEKERQKQSLIISNYEHFLQQVQNEDIVILIEPNNLDDNLHKLLDVAKQKNVQLIEINQSIQINHANVRHVLGQTEELLPILFHSILETQ